MHCPVVHAGLLTENRKNPCWAVHLGHAIYRIDLQKVVTPHLRAIVRNELILVKANVPPEKRPQNRHVFIAIDSQQQDRHYRLLLFFPVLFAVRGGSGIARMA